MDGKFIALVSAVIFHYLVILFCGLVICNWGFVGSLLLGTFFLIATTAVIGTGMVGPATIVCLILAGLGYFNILFLFNILTSVGVSACLLSDD